MLNLALEKPTQQATTPDENRRSLTAVDGIKDDRYAWTTDWWMVDLEAYYLIWEVVITRNETCCRKFIIHTYTHARTHARIHARTHTRTHARAHTHTHTRARARTQFLT